MSYLTESEIEALQLTGLSRETPFLIGHVKSSPISVARHYGGATFNGWHYMYMAEHDQLIRDDVIKWVQRRRRFAEKLERAEQDQKQVDIFGGAS